MLSRAASSRIGRKEWFRNFSSTSGHLRNPQTHGETEIHKQAAEIFAKSRQGTFFQTPPFLENSFEGDAFLQRNLQRILPQDVYEMVSVDLSRFGSRLATEIYSLGRQCELTPPTLQIQNPWGDPHNKVVTCEAWKKLKDISAEEGLIATAYERQFQGLSRLIQMSKNYLFYPSSGLYSCPLAMTDGAAKTLEVQGLTDSEQFSRLTSWNPDTFWTSGQWMTEKRGGSDVAGGTETVAVPQPGPGHHYKLYGYKFFSSATDANMALTLARIVDPESGDVTSGTKGLSLFSLQVDQPHHLHVMRLKQKLGTKQLPTGELLLDGMDAQLIGTPGRGVASIAPMLSITRLHNAAASVSSMRRIISLARDYSQRRVAFGRPIGRHSLHVRTLAQMEMECRAGVILFLEAARLLSLEESGSASDSQQHLLRLLMPLLKLYTAKQSVAVVSEGLECFGGQGYMEDSGIPTILRDVQVTPIWEGTTNVLSLDVLRAIDKSQGRVLDAFQSRVQTVVDEAVAFGPAPLAHCGPVLETSTAHLLSFARRNRNRLDHFARDFSFGLARTLAGSLLVEHALWSGAAESDSVTARRWLMQRHLLPEAIQLDADDIANCASADRDLVFDGYQPHHLLSPLF